MVSLHLYNKNSEERKHTKLVTNDEGSALGPIIEEALFAGDVPTQFVSHNMRSFAAHRYQQHRPNGHKHHQTKLHFHARFLFFSFFVPISLAFVA